MPSLFIKVKYFIDKNFLYDRIRFTVNKGVSNKEKNQLLKRLTGLSDGPLLTQVLLQSALGVVKKDISREYDHLKKQHSLADNYQKLKKVEEKLNKYGAGFGKISGAVEADAKAEAKRTGKEYIEPERPNRLKEAENLYIKETFERS